MHAILLFWHIIVANIDDVRTGVYRLVIYPHVSVGTVRVGIIKDDKLVEGTEAFGVQLILPSYHKRIGLKLGNISNAIVLIKDGMF